MMDFQRSCSVASPIYEEEDNTSCSLDSRLALSSNPASFYSPASTVPGSEEEDLFSTQSHSSTFHQQPKDPRSRAKYNIISRLFFFWLDPLFYLGARHELQQQDLYAHPMEADSGLLLARFNWYWKIELKRKLYGKYPRLWVALAQCILRRFILQGFLILIEAGILLFQSVILGFLTEYFSIEEPTKQETRNAYLYAFGLVILSLVIIIMHSHSFLMGQKMSMMLRIISTAAIYNKVLSLSQATIGQLSVGHIVNIASSDVQRFDPVFPHFPYIWVSPLHLIVFTYLAYQEVGWTAFLASGFIILQVPLQVLFARLFVQFRFKSASLTDKRINIMSEVLSGIRVIKMYTWEYAFKNLVSSLRKQESTIIFKGAIIRTCNLAYMIVSTSIIMWLVLTVHTSTGGELSTRQVFTLLSLLTTLRLSSYFFVLALLGFSEGRVAIQRIQHFLEQDDISVCGLEDGSRSSSALMSKRKSKRHHVYPVVNIQHNAEKIKLSSTCYTDSVLIKVSDMSASWSYNKEKMVLDNINFEVNESVPLLAVIGPVGCGKSSLIQCLLGELKAMEGIVMVKGSISYVSQDPWIFAGTLRDNILFGEIYDKIWYERVLEACSLDEDIQELPERDFTLVGERGVTLSGGQKARVNLARAIYHDADIYLLDDPFSALDVNVAMHIFDNCIRGLLEDRLVVLVTHQIQFALPADKILLIKNGQQDVYNSNEELISQGLDPAHLMGLIDDDEDGEEYERNMFSYKDNVYDPPSPTTISMLSIDQTNEDGHITPFSFASSVYGDDYETRSPVMTPLALFSKSMREMQHANSTSNIAKPKKAEVFVFPIAEGNEADTGTPIPLASSIQANNVNSSDSVKPSKPVNKPPNSPLPGGKLLINKLKTSPPAPNSPPSIVTTTVDIQQPPNLPTASDAWPFANKPPSSIPAVKGHDPWPFAKKLPNSSGPILDNSIPAHEGWPFANKPPVNKLPLAHGKVTNEALPFARKPSSFRSPSNLVHEYSLVPKPLVTSPTHSRKHPKPGQAINASPPLQERTPSPQGGSDRNPTFNILPPTPPLLQPRSKFSSKNAVRSPKLKPSPLILASNNQPGDSSLKANKSTPVVASPKVLPSKTLQGSPGHAAKAPTSSFCYNKSPANSPKYARKTPVLASPSRYTKSPVNTPGPAGRAPLSPGLSPLASPSRYSKSPVNTPGPAGRVPLSPVLSPLANPSRYSKSASPGPSKRSPALSPLTSSPHYAKSPVNTPGPARRTPLSPALSPLTSPLHHTKSTPASKIPLNTAFSPPISPQSGKKNVRRCPVTETAIGKSPQLTSPLHTPASPLGMKTALLSPNMYGKETPRQSKRSPTASPLLGKRSPYSISPLPGRRSALDDNLPTVGLEPGRFDVASIYSARSVISRGSLVAQKVAAAKKLNAKEIPVVEKEAEQLPQEKKSSGTVSLKTYYDFFKAGGGILLILLALFLFILGEVGIVVSDWWLSDWANCFSIVDFQLLSNESSTCLLDNATRISVYTVTTFTATVFSFGRAILFCFICINASRVLHNRMFDTILHAKVLFFDNNPIGKVLNRFSKDIGFLDDLLPYTFCEFILLFLRCLAVIITATVSNGWLLFPAILIITLFVLLRWYYLRSARDVKRLEAAARSPVYTHLSTTLQGLSTIRSYQKEDVALKQLHTVQNQHSQGWYLYLVMVRWFGLRIDMLSVLFLASVAFISIPLSSRAQVLALFEIIQLNAGLVGLSLTYTISLADMLQYMIRLSAEVENTMISAERVIEYGKLEPESSISSDEKPPDDWPSEGEIKMEDVMFQYEIDAPMVLKNLSFTIKKAEKVGIVGRTGAGKSSLIAVLYRLAEPNGQITIDGVETKSIGLHDLRKKMSIIPQDPVLFSGSMRYNLDPFEEYSDAELWEVLEQVQLKAAVEELEGQLSGEMSEGGSNFSVGQRQLVCLARALLRKNKILILDEATANVDPRTDGIIQKAIHETFADCTTLVIAHRLDTIMDSDKIIVLKNGRVKEFDSPYRLLQNPNSKFYLMVEKTGLTASGRLHQMALESHLRRMFKKSGRITPAQSRVGVKKMSSLFARSLLQRATGSGPFGLSRLQERRASILSSNSFPRALNEVGMGGPAIINSNDPTLSSLRLPSDPNLAKESN